jgi:hypothetical protein
MDYIAFCDKYKLYRIMKNDALYITRVEYYDYSTVSTTAILANNHIIPVMYALWDMDDNEPLDNSKCWITLFNYRAPRVNVNIVLPARKIKIHDLYEQFICKKIFIEEPILLLHRLFCDISIIGRP